MIRATDQVARASFLLSRDQNLKIVARSRLSWWPTLAALDTLGEMHSGDGVHDQLNLVARKLAKDGVIADSCTARNIVMMDTQTDRPPRC